MVNRPKLPYKNMDKDMKVIDIIHMPSKKLEVGDIFTFFNPRLILPSYYEVTEKLDFGVKVYKMILDKQTGEITT